MAGAAICLLHAVPGGTAQAAPSSASPVPAASAEHVILFVLEGVNQSSPKTGPMPVLKRLVKDGSVTWSANAVTPALRLPTMASLLTGVPVQKHGVTWDSFDFARGYPRPPTVFDYLDLSGGKDSAIFFMDESLYQLAKPEPYTDYQICGQLRPECTPQTLVKYIRDYFKKATSGEGYGHAILSLPHFLVVHLPAPARAGQMQGWTSRAYQQALGAVDHAMGAVLDLYKELGLLKRTTVFVTTLSSGPSPSASNGHELPQVLWAASGAGIKAGHVITQPVSILDTGATILRTLGLETFTEWESRPVEEIFHGSGGPGVAQNGKPGAGHANTR